MKLSLVAGATLFSLGLARDTSQQLPLAQHVSTTSDDSAMLDLLQALETMQSQFFEVWQGTWPDAIDWTRAVMSTHVAAGMTSFTKSKDTLSLEHENLVNGYFSQLTTYYFGQDHIGLRTQAYDDILWVVLGWLESIQFLNYHSDIHFAPSNNSTWYGKSFSPAFAHRARVFWELATRGWDEVLCGGGIVWSPWLAPYKNAITNELFIAASVNMYLYFPGDDNDFPFSDAPYKKHDKKFLDAPGKKHDKKFLDAAIKGINWLHKSNMTNPEGLYFDGFHIKGWRKDNNGTRKCDISNLMVYTYNQGVILSAYRGLWSATGDLEYLTTGHELIRNVIAATGWLSSGDPPSHEWAGLGRNGVLEDACDSGGYCSQDGQTFKGIFFHHLTVFCQPLPVGPQDTPFHGADRYTAGLHRASCREYAPWVQRNAEAAMGTRDEKGVFGMWWTVGLDDSTVSPLAPVVGVDYRNRHLLNVDYTVWPGLKGEVNERFAARGRSHLITTFDDPNERGRGRTVESHSGGVAVLRAHHEFSKL